MTTLVKMNVSSTDYYISDSGYAGENFWNPFLLSNPRIEWKGDGWIQAQTGNLVLSRDPNNSSHPFSYSAGTYANLLSSPSTQYAVTINHDDEDMSNGNFLWEGKAIFDSISVDSISFNLFSEQPSETFQSQFIGKFPIYFIDNASQCTFEVYAANATPTKFKKGDRIVLEARIESGYAIDGITPNMTGTVVADAVLSRTSPYTLWNIQTDIDRSAYSTQLLNIQIAAVSSPFYSRIPSDASPTWWIHKILPLQEPYLSDKSYKREIPEERQMDEGYDGKPWVVMPSGTQNASSVNFFQDGASMTMSNTELYGGASTGFKYRKTSGTFDGTLTYQFPSGSQEFTINDIADAKFDTIDITKAPNADDTNIAAIDQLINNEYKTEFLDRICKATNYQFYTDFTPIIGTPYSGGTISETSVASEPFELEGDLTLAATLIIGGTANETIYLIDRANTPSAQSISVQDIVSVRYRNPFPIQAVETTMTQRQESGSSTSDNYNFFETEFTLSSFNSNTEVGRKLSTEQMADRFGAQETYLDAILANQIKTQVSLTVDSINKSIKPGDNLTFTERDAPVTVSSLLVRGITYDLSREETTFSGDATITKIEIE